MSQVGSYLAENYGRCTAEVCMCRRVTWESRSSRSCCHWQPVLARTYDELRLAMLALYSPRLANPPSRIAP
jgi:hypothetical protein